MACVVKNCTQETRGKAIMCVKHWYTLPETLREDIRKETDKGAHTLRAQPSREWLAAASKYVGDVKNLSINYEDGKHKRKFQDEKPQDESIASAV
jgi:hypothetical protein